MDYQYLIGKVKYLIGDLSIDINLIILLLKITFTLKNSKHNLHNIKKLIIN